jgi:spoIIIJ-associated protein
MADAILGPEDPDIPLADEDEDEYDDEDDDEEYDDEEDDEYDDEDDEEDDLEEDEESSPFIPSSAPSAPAITLPQTPIQDSEATNAEEADHIQNVDNPSREDIEITVDVLQNILRYMNIHATVQVRSSSPLTLNIRGINENLGLLIGRRGETLAALQLLVNLIVSHRTKHRMRIIVDAENYRERREENLRSLALRVAQQVRNYRRSIALEAMPPHERRIVHIALSESKDISTESIGEGDERRVVISLKRPTR